MTLVLGTGRGAGREGWDSSKSPRGCEMRIFIDRAGFQTPVGGGLAGPLGETGTS